MKICFVTYEGVVLAKGGPYVKIKALKQHLETLGHQVNLFNLWEHSENLADYDVIHVFGANMALYSFVRNLKYRGIDYIVNPIIFSRHKASYIKKINRITKTIGAFLPGIWTDYGITADICKWAKLVLPNTSDEGSLAHEGFSVPSEKIEVVYNGVSDKFLHGDPDIFKKEYGIDNFILTVGHIGPKRKNMLALVRALARIDHPAVIIGKALDTGETAEVMKEISKNKNILYIDAIENDSPLLASAYAACDTFVLPSLFETPGRAALEAALAGAKIVITPYGGTKDYFKDMAVYVNPYDVESIRKGIILSLTQKKSPELKEYIKNNFLWDKVAAHTVEVYSKVLKKS